MMWPHLFQLQHALRAKRSFRFFFFSWQEEPAPRLPLAQSTQDAGRDTCTNWNIFPLMLLARSVDTPFTSTWSHMLALRCASHPASCVDWAFLLRPKQRREGAFLFWLRSSWRCQWVRHTWEKHLTSSVLRPFTLKLTKSTWGFMRYKLGPVHTGRGTPCNTVHANYGTHCSEWECSHRLRATSKGLHANLPANLLRRPVWMGPLNIATTGRKMISKSSTHFLAALL